MRIRRGFRFDQRPAPFGLQAGGRGIAGHRAEAASGALKAFAGAILLVLLAPALALARDAHEPSLRLQVDLTSVSGEWKVPVSDLDTALHLDADRNGEVTWAELEPRRTDIENYLASQLRIRANGNAQKVQFGKLIYGAEGGEALLLSHLAFSAPQQIDRLSIESSMRCALTVIWLGQGMHTAALSGASGAEAAEFSRASAASHAFVELLQTGIWHIWTGYDHVLFLLVLLIPAVFQRTATGREAVPSFRDAFFRVAVIVTAFTIAHSITLTSAALHWINLPSRWVESAIAASIFVAALLNFLPTTAGSRGAWLAFGFGLLHGFGFAGAMSEIDAAGSPLWRTLVAFNLGVEAGQLAIVAAFLPIAFFLRNTKFYRTGVVYGGSTLAGLCAMVWFWNRAF
jgi:hypothetical protein